ncbi:MAG: phenylalanine--tRNA ligase subunit alpha, partial [Verrucomicrobiota bacterium]
MQIAAQIEATAAEARAALASAPDLPALEQAKGAFLGAEGRFTLLLRQLGALPREERPAAGRLVNAAKQELETLLGTRRTELELKAAQPAVPTDFSLPGRRRNPGRLHPLTQVTDDIVRAFRRLGFAVADGPEVEDEYHCFDALNTPPDHPARDAQDTFFVEAPGRPLLRTHTSSVQIRVMRQQPPPVRIVVPGRVFRRDNADATHNPT